MGMVRDMENLHQPVPNWWDCVTITEPGLHCCHSLPGFPPGHINTHRIMIRNFVRHLGASVTEHLFLVLKIWVDGFTSASSPSVIISLVTMTTVNAVWKWLTFESENNESFHHESSNTKFKLRLYFKKLT